MTFDLGKALLRKEEYESARLTELEFAEMVRALKALAAELAVPVERCWGFWLSVALVRSWRNCANFADRIWKSITCAAGPRLEPSSSRNAGILLR